MGKRKIKNGASKADSVVRVDVTKRTRFNSLIESKRWSKNT